MSPEVKAPSTPQRDEDEIEIDEDVDEVDETEEEIEDEEMGDDEEGDMEFDDDEMFDDGMNALGGLLSATLATEDGDTVCTALLDIGSQLATQNKILLKILSTLNKKDN